MQSSTLGESALNGGRTWTYTRLRPSVEKQGAEIDKVVIVKPRSASPKQAGEGRMPIEMRLDAFKEFAPDNALADCGGASPDTIRWQCGL